MKSIIRLSSGSTFRYFSRVLATMCVILSISSIAVAETIAKYGTEYVDAYGISLVDMPSIRLSDPSPTEDAYAIYEFDNIPTDSTKSLFYILYKTEDGAGTALGGQAQCWRYDTETWETMDNFLTRQPEYGWTSGAGFANRHISSAGKLRIRIATKEFTHLWVNQVMLVWTASFALGDSYMGIRKSYYSDESWYGLSGTYHSHIPSDIEAEAVWICGTDIKSYPASASMYSCDQVELMYRAYPSGTTPPSDWSLSPHPWIEHTQNIPPWQDKWGWYVGGGGSSIGPFTPGTTVEFFYRGYSDYTYNNSGNWIVTNYDSNSGVNYSFRVVAPPTTSGFTIGDSYIGIRIGLDGETDWYGLSGSGEDLPDTVTGSKVWITASDIKTAPGYGTASACDEMELWYRTYATGTQPHEDWILRTLPWAFSETGAPPWEDQWAMSGNSLGPFVPGNTVELFFKGKCDLATGQSGVEAYANWDSNSGQNYHFSIVAPSAPSPQLSNVRASQKSGSKLLEGLYNLSGTFQSMPVAIVISTNGGVTYDINGPTYSSVAPGNNRSFSWDMSAALNNKQLSQMQVKVVAGSATAESAVFAVDTRDANRPQVQDISSTYFNKNAHVTYLSGVSLPQTITASVNWNGKTPGTVIFDCPNRTEGLTLSRSVDVGQWQPGDRLRVSARAADGAESDPYPANFDIATVPDGIPDWMLYVIPSASCLKYKTPEFSLNLLDQNPDTVDKNVPIFGGYDVGFVTAVSVSADVNGDGTATATVKAGTGSKMKMAGFDIAPRVLGEFNWTYLPLSQIWQHSGYVGVVFSASMSTPPAYVWAVPPVFFRGDLNMETGLKAGIDGWDGNTPLWNFVWNGEAIFSGVAGCGASGFAAIEGYLGGGPVWTIQAPQPPPLKELGIVLRGGVRVVFLFYTWDAGLLEYEWWFVQAAGDRGMMAQSLAKRAYAQLNAPKSSDFVLMARTYLAGAKPYAVFRSFPSRSLVTRDTGEPPTLAATLNTLQSNVYPYSQPDISTSGSNRIMVWIWDNPERLAENRTELVWSKWMDGAWSNPISVWNEGTADFAPAVRLFPDGSALAVWQNERAILTNGATLEEAFAGLEMAVAKYDPNSGTWTGTNLTDNATIDHSPQLATATNGKALLTWISNASNSPSGSASAPNTIHSRLWVGSAWQDAGNIATNVRLLLWSTVAFDGTNGVFIAAIDGDDDQSTIDDQELYGAVYSAGAWGAFARWTTNSIQDTKPQATYDSSGALLLAWYQGSNLVMRAGDLNLAAAENIGEVGGSSSAKDFKLVTGPAGQISMVWVDMAEDGTGPDPFMINYDFALGAWSKPIRILNNTNLLERSFAGAYSDEGSLLLAYNQVHIQKDTNGVPILTNNVVDLMFMDYLIGGDLGLRAEDISLSTNSPQPGRTIQVSALARNLGELAATNVSVAFYNGNPAGDGVQIGSSQVIPQLAGGANTNISIDWTLPDTVSNQTIYVVVDPGLEQEDRNRANNTASMTAIQPDLVVAEMSVANSEPEKRLVNARVANEGGLGSGQGFDVEFRQGATNGPLVGTSAIEAMPAGGIFDANVEWDLNGLTFTSAYETVYALADAGGAVSEGDRDNNMGLVQIMTTLDTDGDGLFDGEESRYGTSPNVPDSDGDGLKDGEEVNTYGTGPLIPDSDGDGAKDGDEVRAGTDPNSEADVFAITHVDAATGLSVVQWSAKSNKTYQVSRSWELLTWSNAPSGVEADEQSMQSATVDGPLQYIDIESSVTNRSFYRVDLVE